MMSPTRFLLITALVACSKSDPAPTAGSAAPSAPASDAAVAEVEAPPLPDATAAVAGPAAPPDAALEEETLAIVQVLTADDSVPMTGDMAKRKPGADLAQQIEDVRNRGRDVVVGRGSGRRIDPPAANAAGRVSVVDKRAHDDTSLTADQVAMKVLSAYMPGIRRCYKTALKIDPDARGKVQLSFQVNEAGRVVGPKARGFDRTLDECFTALMASWRFPIPKDADGDPTDATFELSFALLPD